MMPRLPAAPSRTPPSPSAWDDLQASVAHVPGERGIQRRTAAYADHFMRYGPGVRISESCHFSHPERVSLDDDVRINTGALIYGSGGVRIGRHARIGPRVFIHSANHDVGSADPRAFFERGYQYQSVTIGDNCLISANVCILPGARIGNGVFIAAGAVVTRGDYPDGCRIMGVPGRVMQPDLPPAPVESPSIALVVPDSGSLAAAAELLIESLGLPQVRVFQAGAKLPPSVHAAIHFGTGTPSSGVSAWRLATGSMIVDEAAPIAIVAGSPASLTPNLQHARVHGVSPTADVGQPLLLNAAQLAGYYTHKRLRKRQAAITHAELVGIVIATCVLHRVRSDAATKLACELASCLPFNKSGRAVGPVLMDALLRGDGKAVDQLAIDTIGETSASGDVGLSDQSVLAALQNRGMPAATGQLIATSSKAAIVAALGCAAIIADDTALAAAAVSRLLSPDMFDESSRCVRSATGASAGSYSPLVAAVLLWAAQREHPSADPTAPTPLEQRFDWHALPVEGGLALIDPVRRVISQSLLDNWLACLTVPVLESGQYEIDAACYEPRLAAIEAIWLGLFRHIQHAAGRPLVRIHPWPHGYQAALSLRYDIDRHTTFKAMRDIAHLQGHELNAACASWYAIPDTKFGDQLRPVLPLYLQEVGIHGLAATDARSGEGLTFHSAPNSRYWRGESTMLQAESHDAQYSEMLATQLLRPRRAWIGSIEGGRATRLPLTPLHFPLEGSTTDTTLDYFDGLRDAFREAIERGGHVIIGSHPDLNQAILRDLIAREGLSRLWCAPIRQVIDRCDRVLGTGNISVVQSGEPNSIMLLSRHTLADVSVEIEPPPGDGPAQCIAMQLNAGVARAITCEPAPN